MSESYCMKSCSECGGCTGCRTGAYSAQCDIAKCCREKGHLSCESCTRSGGCPTRLSRDRMPGMIREREYREAQALQSRRERVSVMKTWLPLVFGGMITLNVIDLVLGFFVYFVGGQMLVILNALAQAGLLVTVGFGYWKLQRADDGFYFVAICYWLSAVYHLLDSFMLGESLLGGLLALLLAVVGVISMRSEYLGFRDALSGVDRELLNKWDRQWTQTLYALAGFGISLVLFLIPVLGALVMLCCMVFMLFLIIRHLVYLYQTMDRCREYDLG